MNTAPEPVVWPGLTIELFDRHEEHVDEERDLCEHGEIRLGLFDSAFLYDGTGERFGLLELVARDRLRITIDTDEYRKAKRQRRSFLPRRRG